MNRLDKLWWYDQQWEYCEEIKNDNFIYVKIPYHVKTEYTIYKVNYIPFLFPRVVFNLNKLNLISGKPVERILMPVILTDEK